VAAVRPAHGDPPRPQGARRPGGGEGPARRRPELLTGPDPPAPGARSGGPSVCRCAATHLGSRGSRLRRKDPPMPPSTIRTRTIGVVSVAALALGLASCGSDDGAGSGEAQLLQEGTLVVAMSGEFQPFSHFEGNQLTGFDYDIAAAIAEEMGLELDAQTGAFDTLIQGVSSNRYDVLIASMTPTEERDRAVDFTDSYYGSG